VTQSTENNLKANIVYGLYAVNCVAQLIQGLVILVTVNKTYDPSTVPVEETDTCIKAAFQMLLI
jgi:hypothetical protein